MLSGEEFLLLQDRLGLTSCNGKFFILNRLGLRVLRSLPLGLGLGFSDAANAGKSEMRAKNSVNLVVLWGNEKGKIILKNILTAGNTEAKDGRVG